MNVHHSLILVSSLLCLSGCASLSLPFGKKEDVKPIEVKTQAVERTKLNLAMPAPLQSREIDWVVITPSNAEEVWKKLKEKNVDVVLIGLTDDGYQELALTIAELRNLIATQRTIILKYKDYYESSKTPDTK